MRDTLRGILSGGWEFNRDLNQAGAETVRARAAVLRNRCGHAAIAVRRTPGLLDAAVMPIITEPAQRRLRDLKIAMNRLHEVLRGECQAGFPAEGPGQHADSLRAWGPYRVDQVERAISSYEKTAEAFAASLGIRLEPG